MVLKPEDKLIGIGEVAVGTVVPLLLEEFADQSVMDWVFNQTGVAAEWYQLPSVDIPIAAGAVMLLIAGLDLVDDDEIILAMLLAGTPMLVLGIKKAIKYYQATHPAASAGRTPARQGATSQRQRIVYQQPKQIQTPTGQKVMQPLEELNL